MMSANIVSILGVCAGVGYSEILILRTIIGLSLLVFTAKLLAGICSRCGFPPVIGEVLAGIILGPNLLGGLITFMGEPIIQINEISLTFATIGGVILLFSVGLEFTFAEFKRVGLASFLIGIIDTVLAFTLGVSIVLLLGYPWPTAGLAGATITATSIAITAKTLEDLGKIRTKEATMMINLAVVDDIMTLAILSIVSSAVFAGEILPLEKIIIDTIIAVGLWLVMLFTAPRFVPHLIEKSAILGREEAAEAAATAVCFGFAFLTSMFGLSPLVGAYAAGVAIASSRLITKIKEYIEHLDLIFGTLFFAMIGVQFNVFALASMDGIFFILLLIVAILGKIIGCGFTSALYLRDLKRGLRVGVGMLSRGEVGLIVAGLGYRTGFLSESIYVSLVSIVLLTTFITPILLKLLYRKSEKNTKLLEVWFKYTGTLLQPLKSKTVNST